MAPRPIFSILGALLTTLATSLLHGDEPVKKLPPPSAAAESEAAKLIRDVYGKELTAAKTVDQKKALASKILQMAEEKESNPTARFCLLRLTRNIAIQAGDCPTALAAVEETDKTFQIDAAEMKSEVLHKCASSATTVEQHALLADKAVEIIDAAVATDNFSAAKSLVEFAMSEAKKAKDDSLAKRLMARRGEIEAIARVHEAVKIAIATLEKTPLDPEANLTAGKYTCFLKGDWTHGLPMLALSSDPALKTLSEQEIKGVASSEEQAQLGDAWWEAAEAQQGSEKKQLEARAAYWYQSALPALIGLPKDKVASRLRKIQVNLPTFLADLQGTEIRVDGPEYYVDFRTLFKGKVSPHTIWGHPPGNNSSSHRAYQLDGHFRVLRGMAGIGSGDKKPPFSQLTFRIVGDGKKLWQSKPLQERDSSVPFDVNVAKVKKLELFVDCPGDHSFAWALWIDPILEH